MTPSALSPVAISLSRAVSRSAVRRELVNTIVDRCWPISSATLSSTWGQMLALRRSTDSPSSSYSSTSRRPASGSVMSSTGTTTWRSHDLCAGGATISTGA
jgi:hypothetical protein